MSSLRITLFAGFVLALVAGCKPNTTTTPATNPEDILLKVEMSAGHGGVSGRYDAWRDRAFSYAWIVDRLT